MNKDEHDEPILDGQKVSKEQLNEALDKAPQNGQRIIEKNPNEFRTLTRLKE